MFATTLKASDASIATALIQTGDIVMDTRPFGSTRTAFLYCDGSAISRAVYADLDALYAGQGYPFGNGDGVTTFNIPDFRGRSPMANGTGTGLTARAMGNSLGEEIHVLTSGENGTHTHLQNSHNHTQDAHTHTQDAHNHTQDVHNHTQDAHSHTQNSHNHTQDAHLHAVTDPGHAHTQTGDNSVVGGNTVNANIGGRTGANAVFNGTASNVTSISNQNTTATNQATTATNQNATATNQATTATNQATTATNQNATATNQAATAVNQDSGLGTGHNTIHPVLCVNFWVKY